MPKRLTDSAVRGEPDRLAIAVRHQRASCCNGIAGQTGAETTSLTDP